jgi:four helix bundle protein
MENGEYKERKESILRGKSFAFALRVLKLNKFLIEEKREFVLSKQIIRSGIGVGALIWESENAASRKDFIHKLTIALKEADETDYWLAFLFHSNYIEERIFQSLKADCIELIKLLIASVKTTKLNTLNSPL